MTKSGFRRVAAGALALALALPAAAPVQAKEWKIPPFEATYRAKIGIARGETRMELRRLDAARFEIESWTEARGFASWFKRGEIHELSRFRWEDGRIVPELFRRTDDISSEDRNVSVLYRPDEGVALVTHRGDTREVDISERTTNPLVMQIALMQDLALGEGADYYETLDHAGIRRYEVEYQQGTEPVEVPAGAFSARRLRHSRDGTDTFTQLWCSPEFDWLAVRAEINKDGKVRGRLSLEKYAPGRSTVASLP